MDMRGKIILGAVSATGFIGVAGISGWGARFLAPQTVEEALIKEGFRPLNTDSSSEINRDTDKEQWVKKMKLAKEDNKGGYLYTLAAGLSDSESQQPNISKIDDFRKECYSKLKTSYLDKLYSESYNIAKKYCVANK